MAWVRSLTRQLVPSQSKFWCHHRVSSIRTRSLTTVLDVWSFPLAEFNGVPLGNTIVQLSAKSNIFTHFASEECGIVSFAMRVCEYRLHEMRLDSQRAHFCSMLVLVRICIELPSSSSNVIT
jgi:hypothetical protein